MIRKLEIKVLSEKKGSNPGGNCRFDDGVNRFNGYFKYVYGGKNLGSSLLVPKHQPVYEAITFKLANEVGLTTSSYFVLSNQNKNVDFINGSEDVKNHCGREYYFISKLEKGDNSEEIGSKIISNEKVYLDSLNVADIIGKRQNYCIVKEDLGYKSVYIDLGCSFVHAVEGFIHIPNGLKKVISKKFDNSKLKKLNGINVISADNSNIVNLGSLIEKLPYLEIPILNPLGNKHLKNIISEVEIDEIKKYLLDSTYKSLSEFKKLKLIL